MNGAMKTGDELAAEVWEGGLGLAGYVQLGLAMSGLRKEGHASVRRVLLLLVMRSSPQGVRVVQVEAALGCHQTAANNELRGLVARGWARRSGSQAEGYTYVATRALREYVDQKFERLRG